MRRALGALALALALTTLPAAGAGAGTVALVIDDLGHSAEHGRRALALAPPVAVAILPGTAFAGRIARAAERAQADVLVHLPMEAEGQPVQPGMLHAAMRAADFRQRVRDALASLPQAIGINNHMGSRLTGAVAPMNLLMDELTRGDRPLLFIDSRTTAATRAADSARTAGIATAERDVFLDHDPRPAAVERQVRRWLTQARVEGCALAIGHPRAATFAVLERVLPRARGIDRVDLRTYVERCGDPAGAPGTRHASWPRSPATARSAEASH